jgi:hypothetical protein
MPNNDAVTTENAAKTDTDTQTEEKKSEAKGKKIKASKKAPEKTAEKPAEPPKGADMTVGSPKYKYVIKSRKARRETKERKAVTIIAVVLVLIILAAGIIYGFYSAVNINNFSIYVESSGNRVLSLSATDSFTSGTQVLEISGPSTMDNVSLHYKSPNDDEPLETKLLGIITGSGQQSTKNDKYIAASFYLRNTTSDVQYYNEYLKMTEHTQGIEKALRVMLVKNNDITVYAMADDNGNPVEVVPIKDGKYTALSITADESGETPIYTLAGGDVYDAGDETVSAWYANTFYDADKVFYNKGFSLDPGQTVKYSIIIWLEGQDPECVNSILGGLLRIEFAFEQVV